MKKKNILIVINSMELGGAQKSLLSFLRSLEEHKEADNYRIDLIVARPCGIFMDQFPQYVRLLEPSPELLWLATPRGHELLSARPSLKGRFGKFLWAATNKQRLLHSRLNEEQRIWLNWRHLVPKLDTAYDVAISYMNGFPNYYVMEKVTASRKILWVHNEYQKLGYDISFDQPYYAKCDRIITISQACVDSFTQVYPDLSNKVSLLQNITLASDVLKKGALDEAPEFHENNVCRILSVGRLSAQKQFNLAVSAAAVLKQHGFGFKWLILGDGEDQSMLQQQINSLGLENEFFLAGAKNNPYAYMSRCDVFVQTSLFEGKSIVLDEAKLFLKPLVVTNYPTVTDTITNEKTGLICPMEPSAIAEQILRVARNQELQDQLANGLQHAESGSDALLKQYIQLMLK